MSPRMSPAMSSAGPGEVDTNLHQPMLTGAAANVGSSVAQRDSTPARAPRSWPRRGCRARGPQTAGAPPLRSGLPSKSPGGRRVHRHSQDGARRRLAPAASGRAAAVSHDHRQARTRLPPGGSERPTVIDVTGPG